MTRNSNFPGLLTDRMSPIRGTLSIREVAKQLSVAILAGGCTIAVHTYVILRRMHHFVSGVPEISSGRSAINGKREVKATALVGDRIHPNLTIVCAYNPLAEG